MEREILISVILHMHDLYHFPYYAQPQPISLFYSSWIHSIHNAEMYFPSMSE